MLNKYCCSGIQEVTVKMKSEQIVRLPFYAMHVDWNSFSDVVSAGHTLSEKVLSVSYRYDWRCASFQVSSKRTI